MKRILWGLILILFMSACTIPEQEEAGIDNEIVQDENDSFEEPEEEILDAYITLGQSFNYENITVHFEDIRRGQVIITIEIKDK